MPNWGGAAAGAGAGALTGSALGPWGAAGGAVLGGLGGLFSGNKDKLRKIGVQTPEQEALLRTTIQEALQGQAGQNYGQANDYVSQMLSGSPEAYQRFAAPYETQFQEQTLPGIAERFAGLGGPFGHAISSSGFGQAIGGAATQFKSNLAGLYAQLQQQAAQSAFGQQNQLTGFGLGTQAFQPTYQPGNLGFGGTALSGIAQGAGTGFGQAIGTNLSSRFANMFGNNNQQNQSQSNPVNPGVGEGYFNQYFRS